ncbi:BMP family ABC transporter substrate-binding protein [Tumebacillus sp. DT12]|uniref:BMP family ABC transporter substrate-binding protein n=1 Tax=Tumebacillus lacus TaxID=2995335 RepID=A0ABT3WV75_9BACL|nr:BMP family ABC transporter substrate-binding protein [Tumebacillus lacus]MCX7568588.1 BMP family ABC transporter substrate-binding protein [Tumebacillus lacus]
MKGKKLMSAAFAGILAASMLAGCGTSDNKDGGGAAGGDQGKKMNIAMVTDVGGIHDNSFNQAAWEGLTRAKEKLGVEVKVQESKRAEDYTPNLTSFVKSGTDLTWGIGFLMENDIKKVATENPDSHIGIIDSNLGGEIPKNVASVTFKEEEGSFLMGVLAGKMTKSNKVGFVGGVKFALIEKFEYGFKAGVKSVNPGAEVIVAYADAFDKPDKGSLLASQIYQQGADIIFHASGATGDGVFKEAVERGANHWVIGVDRDQSNLAPKNTLSSMVKRVDNAVYQVTEQLKNGKWSEVAGKNTVLGLKEDGVGYAPTTSTNTPQDVITLMDDYKKKIVAGEIKVPATAEAFNNFK